MYGLNLIESCDDVYGQSEINPALKIKTFYEGLDIAGSNKIFYLKFSLPEEIKNLDDELQQLLKETEHSD
jgi:tRNA (guanine-N7-)-methyltransferase